MDFISKTKIKIKKESKIEALNLILNNNLEYLNLKSNENGDIIIVVYSRIYKKFEILFKENHIEYLKVKEYGVFSFFKSLKTRYGLIIGVCFLILTIYISSNLVWKINIEGNSTYSDEEILSILEEVDFRLGTFIPNIDYDKLHNRILLKTDKISWVSINIKGNIANVEIKETIKEEDKENESLYSNIVASKDGYIFSVEAISGESVVSEGQIVKKGDLLISGVINSQSLGTRYVNANGTIKAYTNKHILIKIPVVSEEKIYTGRVFEQKKLKIFSKYINFSFKDSNYSEFCDKIEKKEDVTFLGIKNLPLEKITSRFYEYKIESVTRSKEKVVDIAFAQLKKETDTALKSAELISKSIKTDFDGDYFYIYCDLYCIEDIAQEVQFTVDQ